MTVVNVSAHFLATNPKAQSAIAYVDRLLNADMEPKAIRSALHKTATMVGENVFKGQKVTSENADKLAENRIARAYLATVERPQSASARRLFEDAVLGVSGPTRQSGLARQIRAHARDKSGLDQ